MKRIALAVALCLSTAHAGTAHAGTVWVNYEHPDRDFDSEAQLCHDAAWISILNEAGGESKQQTLIDTSAGTASCLTRRGWFILKYVPSKD